MDAPVQMTLAEVADLVGGRVEGDASARIRGVSSLADATDADLGLLADARYKEAARSSAAGALLVSESLAGEVDDGRPQVVVADAHGALVPLLEALFPPDDPAPGVHPTAVLGRNLEIGLEVSVGPYAVVEDGASLGDRVRVGAHAVVGRGCRIGADSVLHPHVVLYPGCELGRRVILHAGVRVGVDGFGYAPGPDGLRKIPQVGGCVVEDDVEIGGNACLDRGSIGHTRVGRGTKLDNLVHVAHNVRIGPSCAAAAQVGIAGSTTLGPGVMLGGQAGLVGHLDIGAGAQIAAQSGVIGNLGEGDSVTGYPARDLKQYMKAYALFMKLPGLVRRLRDLEARVAALDTGGAD